MTGFTPELVWWAILAFGCGGAIALAWLGIKLEHDIHDA